MGHCFVKGGTSSQVYILCYFGMNMVAQNCNSEEKTTGYKLHHFSFIAGFHDTHVIAALLIVESLTNTHMYARTHAPSHAYI